jgi:hypothetical protein
MAVIFLDITRTNIILNLIRAAQHRRKATKTRLSALASWYVSVLRVCIFHRNRARSCPSINFYKYALSTHLLLLRLNVMFIDSLWNKGIPTLRTNIGSAAIEHNKTRDSTRKHALHSILRWSANFLVIECSLCGLLSVFSFNNNLNRQEKFEKRNPDGSVHPWTSRRLLAFRENRCIYGHLDII